MLLPPLSRLSLVCAFFCFVCIVLWLNIYIDSITFCEFLCDHCECFRCFHTTCNLVCCRLGWKVGSLKKSWLVLVRESPFLDIQYKACYDIFYTNILLGFFGVYRLEIPGLRGAPDLLLMKSSAGRMIPVLW